MPTRSETLDFLLDQLGEWPGLRTRRMFGEYCVYVDDRPVAFVCDNLLYVKPTPAGEALMTPPVWGRFYDKARPHLLVSPELWDDRHWLRGLLQATADALPLPKARKPRAGAPGATKRTRKASATDRPAARTRTASGKR